jgi:hypothetical protein
MGFITIKNVFSLGNSKLLIAVMDKFEKLESIDLGSEATARDACTLVGVLRDMFGYLCR